MGRSIEMEDREEERTMRESESERVGERGQIDRRRKRDANR